MQVFRTVMITCILIIWPLVTFEDYFCNSCILHKRTHILIKLHIGSYFYKYIQSYTNQHMPYISYLLWYNLTPRVSHHGPTIGQRVRPRHRQNRVVRGITWTKRAQCKTEYANTQQGLPVHGILSHVTRLMKALMVVGKIFSWKATKSRSLISNFSFQVLGD
jgi:hypothetical protein